MNEREALLRAVCENPDEDTPRLVFADWLQENGEEERAELIRLQVQAERFPLSSKARQAFFARERELLVRHETIWRAELPNGFYGHPFIRGFTEGANLGDHHPFGLSELTALFEAAPLVELTLFHLSDPGMLATLPSMGRLRRLEIGLQDPTDGSVERFLRATNLTGLQRLIVFTSSAVGWNSAGVSTTLTERFRARFRGVFQER